MPTLVKNKKVLKLKKKKTWNLIAASLALPLKTLWCLRLLKEPYQRK